MPGPTESAIPPWPIVLMLIFFAVSVIVSIWFTATGGNQADKAKVNSAFAAVFSLNFIMTLLLFGAAMYYVGSNPNFERPYLMIMTHLAILFSLTALSVTTFKQLESATIITSATGGCPS